MIPSLAELAQLTTLRCGHALIHHKDIDRLLARGKIIVGVNEFTSCEQPINILVVDQGVAATQRRKLRELRERRNHAQVQSTLETLGNAARTDQNLMPFILNCVRSYATLGEICDVLRRVFGKYEEPAFR